MLRDQHCDVKKLKSLSHKLEESGYESVLLTFNSQQPDWFIRSAAAIVPGQKLKYMIALRPYHVSPQYCSMMTIGYSQIDSDRLMFNWVAGEFHNREDEPDIEFDIYNKSDHIDTIQKRTTFLRDFVNTYKLYCPTSLRPRMVFGGFSDYTLDTVKIFNGTSLCMIDTYRENINKFNGIDSRMVSANITILNSDKDINEYINKVTSVDPRHIKFSIIGNYETVKRKILELEKEKITDLLVFTDTPCLDESWNLSNDMMVNRLIKDINSGVL